MPFLLNLVLFQMGVIIMVNIISLIAAESAFAAPSHTTSKSCSVIVPASATASPAPLKALGIRLFSHM